MALSINASKVTARVLAQALQMAGREIQRERQARQTPHGKQTVAQLIRQGVATSSLPVDAPRDFDRVARRWNVDYAFYKGGDGKCLLFFKSGQADAITACFSEYSRRVLRGKTRWPIRERLALTAERVRHQPRKEREREVEREDR